MTFWGFNISEARVIDLDKNDRNIAKYVQDKVPSYRLCIGCGACTATCSARSFTDFNIRKLQMLMQRGETDTLEKEITKCMLCGKCQLVCPRGVNTRQMIITTKEAIQKYNKNVL